MTTIIDFSGGSGRGRVISAISGMTESQALGFLDQNGQILTASQTAAQQSTASAADASVAATRAENAEGVALAPAAEVIADTFSNSTTAAVQRVGVLTPVTVDHAGVQAALDTAAANGLRVQAAGEYTTDQTLTITSDADLSGLTINYTGASTACRIGSTTEVLHRATIAAPRVKREKGGVGWGGASVGTVGYDLVNINSCMVQLTFAQTFEVGLLERGAGAGNAYNTIMLGHLDNNKINQRITADATGWCNQNTHIGGRLSHWSSEGTSVAGTRHVLLDSGLANAINANTWIGTSLESDIPEYHAEIAGQANMLQNCRWEVPSGSTPRLKWADNAVRNVILFGYLSGEIAETHGVAAGSNQILSGRSWKVYASNLDRPVAVFENQSSSVAPVWSVMGAGAAIAGADPATDYGWLATSRLLSGKRPDEGFDRLRLDAYNGRVYIGSGPGEPANVLIGANTSLLLGGSTQFGPLTDGAADLGSPAHYRFNYVRAKTATVTGAFATTGRPSPSVAGVGASIFDTTLGRPLWSNGSTWVDSTGTPA